MWAKIGSMIANKIKNKDSNESGLSKKNKRNIFIALGSVIFLFFLILVVVITVVFGPIMIAQEMIDNIKEGVSNFFEKTGNLLTSKGWCTDSGCSAEAERKYYARLESAYNLSNGVVDVQLINATVFYGSVNFDETYENSDNDESEEVDDDKKTEEYQEARDDATALALNMVSGPKENLRLDYTKYKNYLINTYIPKRFKHLYPYSDDDEKSINKIADEIMMFASKKEINSSNLAYNSLGLNCSVVSLKDVSGEITIHELEEYVAGVVTAENVGGSEEARKLQAIAARSYAVKNCDRVLVNSIGDIKIDGKRDQAYKTPSEMGIAAAQATNGLILSYNDDVMTINFASYPRAFYNGFPNYPACSDVICETGSDGREWCKTTLYKQPNMETYELYMPDVQLSGGTWNGFHLNNQGGHCYGISQLASNYYTSELGYTYEQMIEEFLSPGVTVVSLSTLTADGGSNVALFNEGYFVRKQQPEINNAYFFSGLNYSFSNGNVGQCTWYSFGRANEVLASVGSNLKWTIARHAGMWYDLNIKNGTSAFQYSSDVTKPRAGSIIVWGQSGSYGHVGFVERVNEDGTIDYTESNIRTVKSVENKYGWRYRSNISTDEIKNMWSNKGYYFIGYIYLLG